jgi:CRP/FNR family transcriptional regulator
LSNQLPNLQHHFFAIMGNEIAKDLQIHTLLSSYTAEERTASFLLDYRAAMRVSHCLQPDSLCL